MKHLSFIFFLNTMILSGCAASRGFSRAELRDTMETKVVVNEKEIQAALALKPQLPKPFKIGVYLKDLRQRWHWSDEDKKKLFAWAEQLKKQGEVTDVFSINSDLALKDDLKSIRYAAAQHGADAVLVVSGISDIDSYNTKWSWTYLGILPMLFVHGDQLDALFLARAALWDVKNQYLYLTAEAESLKSESTPLVSKNERHLVETTKSDALAALSDELSQRMSKLLAK